MERSTYSDNAIDLSYESGWGVSLRRETGTMTFQVRRRVPDDELVHPLLAPAAMHFAAWLGHAAFHGGAFVQNGRAFGVLAERNHGKSTTLARLRPQKFLCWWTMHSSWTMELRLRDRAASIFGLRQLPMTLSNQCEVMDDADCDCPRSNHRIHSAVYSCSGGMTGFHSSHCRRQKD